MPVVEKEGRRRNPKRFLVVNFGKGVDAERLACGTRRSNGSTSKHGGGFGRVIGGTSALKMKWN